MEFKSARETAEAWGVSERLVQRLCATGRVAGAQKLGGSWVVPADARKPADPRKEQSGQPSARQHPDAAQNDSLANKGGWDVAETLATLMPLMNSPFEPGTCHETIARLADPKMQTIARAEFCYFSGDAEGAAQIADDLLSHANLSVRLSACLLYAYANLPLGNINRARFALAELRGALEAVPNASSAQSQAAATFVGYTSAVLLHLPLPENAPATDELVALLPPGLRSFALYVRAHGLYLKGDYARSLGVVEAALLSSPETYPIPHIYLRLAAVMDCISLKQTDEARNHLLAAWKLARPDGLIEPFGEHHGLLGGMLESVIKKDWPEDFKRIIDITYRFSAGWRRVHNPATEETVADNLTTTEFAVSMLAARGWTNLEIGQHLGVSTNTVKSYLASAFRKLGISKRQDLKQFMLR